ncbi:mannitol dehydrogenase family protein [Salipiger mangrovisoli]|uniref:Mannitol dehydrogenase family protein n=1 Tax=Salipiger mangrovisoli TaxID=2865933 RepID=A0ABR9X0N0_9RHOB|nr:mannitol dehydrogenase family protein [Salipiger mangrovisoli]MBE9637105.1 mannitol dehydrogenase family protein [Salipiger mangrovisoli]
MRLTSLDQVPEALRPGYDPQAHGVGIVHLGLGAFHKAHQAALTDLALAAAGGDWRILGVSLRSPKASDELHPQNGLFTLIAKGAEGTEARVIGAIADAICSAGNPEPALAAMAAEGTKIVSLTVTEKAYGLDRAAHGCDPAHPAVAADLANPAAPQGVLGLLTEALRRRRAAGLAPFTVLCCDNLPENGVLLRGAVVDFARRIDPALSEWIAAEVAFPSTMVDRITPAATPATLAEAQALIGCEDLAAIETESFCQWVIEDNFPQGRPAWEKAGAIFTDNVTAFEMMKLRMLNGSHSMLAYVGFHAGATYVRDVMGCAPLARLVRRHLTAAAATLPEIPGIEPAAYAVALARRFENPEIAHETFQIAMDGSEKMPQRVFSAVADARAKGIDCRAFTFATAAWARHLSGATHDCAAYELRDPRAGELRALAQGREADEIVAALRKTAFVPAALAADDAYWDEVTKLLAEMLFEPMRDVIAREAAV